MNTDNIEHILADSTSIAIILGTVADSLPPIAALVSIIWFIIRIYETDTVQRMLGNRPSKGDKDAV